MILPAKDEFEKLASGGGLVPVFAELLADFETPLSAYWKLAHDAECSFLLESVTGGESLARYSFLGVNPRTVIRSKNSDDADQLEAVRAAITDHEYVSLPGLPRFTGGAVGFIAYDYVRSLERLPDSCADDVDCDDVCFQIAETIVAFDHAKNRILVISHATSGEESYQAACERVSSIVVRLRGSLPPLPTAISATPEFNSNVSRDAFLTGVNTCIEYIAAGDVIQVVMSQRRSAAISAHPLTVYRALRSINPSPYMYLIRMGDCDIVGASPEVLVTLDQGKARVRPIAGTRPRGSTPAEDAELATELLADEKERAEHVMLVDLGRNDLGRVAQAGSVTVNELMCVERYSHVMHIVSDITGKVKPELGAFDVLRACFPAGTVSGAPKVRAMEIIDELETTRRGLYAGAVGYFGLNGDMDMAIAIRTVFIKDGIAHVQAGAGIVYDSIPEREWDECHNKAAAVISAIRNAELGELT